MVMRLGIRADGAQCWDRARLDLCASRTSPLHSAGPLSSGLFIFILACAMFYMRSQAEGQPRAHRPSFAFRINASHLVAFTHDHGK